MAESDCSAAGAGPGCTWRLVSTKRKIVAQCLEVTLALLLLVLLTLVLLTLLLLLLLLLLLPLQTRVTDAVRKSDPACFSACPQPRNASTACVVGCYMHAILGAAGGTRLLRAGEGVDPQVLVSAWDAAFDSVDPAKGGCPDA